VTRIRAGRPRNLGSILLGKTNFSLFVASGQALEPTKSPVQWEPGINRQEHEDNQGAPSSAEIKKGRAIVPLPHKFSWRGAYLTKPRNKFILHFIHSSMSLQPLIGPWPFLNFRKLFTQTVELPGRG
jgi:hypothetical protein